MYINLCEEITTVGVRETSGRTLVPTFWPVQ